MVNLTAVKTEQQFFLLRGKELNFEEIIQCHSKSNTQYKGGWFQKEDFIAKGPSIHTFSFIFDQPLDKHPKYCGTFKGGFFFRKCDSFFKSPNLQKKFPKNYPKLEIQISRQ